MNLNDIYRRQKMIVNNGRRVEAEFDPLDQVTKDEKTARPRSTTKIAKTRSSAVFGAILLVAGMNCVNDLVSLSLSLCLLWMKTLGNVL